MKKFFAFLGLLLSVPIVIILFNTFMARPWPIRNATVHEQLPDSAIVHMQQAVRIATVSPEDTTHIDSLNFNRFRSFLETAYPLIHQHLERTIIKGYSYIYTWKGTDMSMKPLILMGHYDVVPVEPSAVKLWAAPPFGGELKNGAIWGRGSVDDKSAVISIFETVENLLRKGYQPKRSILLCFGHNEESTGTGAIAIVDYLQQKGIRAEMVLDEGGEITTDKLKDVKRPVALIGVSEKGYATFELSVQVPGGHSSKPAKETAIDILAKALYKLRSTEMAAHLTPAVKEFLVRISGSSNDFLNKMATNNLWLFTGTVEKIMSAMPEGNAMVRTTIVPTILESGIRENVIPSNAKAIVNSRILTGEKTADVLAFIKSAIKDDRVEVKVSGDFNTEPSPCTDITGNAFHSVEEAIYAVTDSVITTPYIMIGASDSRSYRKISDGVVNFNPMIDSKGFHGIDERLPVSDFRRAVNFFTTIIRNADNSVQK
jgi:carboxypeptidase PM20D1